MKHEEVFRFYLKSDGVIQICGPKRKRPIQIKPKANTLNEAFRIVLDFRASAQQKNWDKKVV